MQTKLICIWKALHLASLILHNEVHSNSEMAYWASSARPVLSNIVQVPKYKYPKPTAYSPQVNVFLT